MSLPVRLRALARAEYDTAADDYERRAAGLGARFTAAVDAVLARIGDFPEMYAVLRRGVRAARVRRYRYVVLYRVLADQVEVIGVIPARSNPATWQERT